MTENVVFAVESIDDFVLFEVVEAVLVVILGVSILGAIVAPSEAEMIAGIVDCSCIEPDKVDSRRSS